MQLSQIADDIRAHFQTVEADAKRFLEEHVPGIAAAAQKLESSPVVQALEGTFLPPEVEAEIASLIKVMAAKFPEPASAAEPAAPESAA